MNIVVNGELKDMLPKDTPNWDIKACPLHAQQDYICKEDGRMCTQKRLSRDVNTYTDTEMYV